MKLTVYIGMIKAHLKENAWVELVGANWIFIFKDEMIEFDSVVNDRRIMERCRKLNPGVAGCRSVMEMLSANSFYQDVLFHADYGDMIHSGEFTGTPGATARYDVGKWLENRVGASDQSITSCATG